MFILQNCYRTLKNANRVLCRYQTTISASQKLTDSHLNVENFEDLMARRQAEALRSVMIEVDKQDVCGQVYHHCKQFGEIKNAFAYTLKDKRNLMLLEFDDVSSVKKTFKYSAFQSDTVKWPNRLLSLRDSKLNSSLPKEAPLKFENANEPPVADILRNANTFDEQVNLLYEHTRLSDLSIRLKFITALQAQTVVNEFLDSMFPNAKIYPFGSTINGFGKMGCDLDMVLLHDQIDDDDENQNQPLLFQGKQVTGDEDIATLEGRQVKCIASLIDYFLLGSSEVSAFAGAKVPIVRYIDSNVDCSVDISINNIDGFQISEYMYAMGLLDPRIRPFIFMVRAWAREFEVSRFNIRETFTNFQLTYMCLTFLQQLKEPLIPTFNDVIHQISESESKSVDDIIKETFIFNFYRFRFRTKNSSTILELFKQFLEYYEAYDMSAYMITLRTIDKVPKPDPLPLTTTENAPQPEAQPLYLENVFQPEKPWGGNVSDAECSTMKIMIRKTLQDLEQYAVKPTDVSQDWGLLEIISKLK